MPKTILVMNLGSSSTKIAVYEGLREIFNETISHTYELVKPKRVWDLKLHRKEEIIKTLQKNQYDMTRFSLIVCRGGAMKPVAGGVYVLNEKIIGDLKSEKYGTAMASVGNLIAYEFGKELGIPVITANPPVTDELCSLARYTGLKGVQRRASWHALNQKRTARQVASILGSSYEELNLVVAHLGSGISVGAHEKGKTIDVNNALDGDGPFAIERAGTVPAADLIRLCYSGKYSEKEMLNLINGNAGMVALLGTKDGLEIERRIQAGDTQAQEVFQAMAFQVAKEIGAMASVLKGQVDALILTGSLANSARFVGWIKERVAYLGELYVVPGENEMLALAENGLRYLNGEVTAKDY